MKAGLVLRAFKICAPQLVDCPIVPPNESAKGEFDQVGEDNIGPELAPTNILRCKLHERSNVAVLVVEIAASNDAHRDQNSAAQDGEDYEDIPDHPQKPHEENGV